MEILLVLLLILLLINYVETMVTPALPTIQNDFGVSENLVSWVTTAFTISAAVAAPIMGKFADVHGKKKTLLAILSAYTIAVFIAGISPNIYVLILARLIQGIGFSAFPISVAIITDMLPPPEGRDSSGDSERHLRHRHRGRSIGWGHYRPGLGLADGLPHRLRRVNSPPGRSGEGHPRDP
jgi:Arabinose efflux permease